MRLWLRAPPSFPRRIRNRRRRTVGFMTKASLSPAEVSGLIAGLKRLAANLWWTWNQEAQEIFQELSPRGWQNLYHNAVAILHEVSDYELRVRLQDPDFAERVRRCCAAFEAYMNDTNTWAHDNAPPLLNKSGGVFLGGVRLPRDAADCGGRPGHPGRRPRQIGQRPGHRLCRHQPVLPGRLFPAGDRPEQLADGVLHAAEPEEPADRTGARRRGRSRWFARSRSA